MEQVAIQFVVFSLSSAYFFLLGRYFYLLCKLRGTDEYGGKTYTGALFRILASTALLYMAHVLADLGNVRKEMVDAYILNSAALFPLGWAVRLWQYRRNGK